MGKQVLLACCGLHVFFHSIAFGQTESFKRELYDRGMTLLAAQKPPVSVLVLEKAFQAAASIDPENLLTPLVERYRLATEDAIEFDLSVAPYSTDRDFICRFLPQVEWDTDDGFLWMRSAYRLGAQNVELKSLLEELFDSRRDLEHDEPTAETSRHVLSDPRVSLFCFSFHLGQLSRSNVEKPLSFFQRHVSDDRLRFILRARYLATVASSVFTLSELVNQTQEHLPKSLQSRVLWQRLQSLDADVLKANAGHEFIQNYLETYFDAIDQRPDKTLEEYASVLEELSFRFDKLFPQTTPGDIVELLHKAGWIQSESEMLDVILRFKPGTEADTKKWCYRWVTAVLERCLEVGDRQQAEEIAQKYAMPLPFSGAISYAIKNGDFSLAEEIAKSEQGSRKQREILAAVLLAENKPNQARPWLVELEASFHKKLNEQPPEKRLHWLVNQVMIMGWQTANPYSSQLPLERAMMDAFESLGDEPQSKKKELLKCLSSFTPPTEASKRLLIKLFHTIPTKIGEPAPFQIDQLCEEICQSDPRQRAALFVQAMRLIDSLKNPDDGILSKIAFAFAVTGDQESINAMLNRIESVDDKIWTLFQCALAFPPRSSKLLSPRFSPRNSGGLF